MPGSRGSHRKHTPIVSEAQRGLFGATYARRKRGVKDGMPGITTKELRSHLKESAGKDLPEVSGPSSRGLGAVSRSTVNTRSLSKRKKLNLALRKHAA